MRVLTSGPTDMAASGPTVYGPPRRLTALSPGTRLSARSAVMVKSAESHELCAQDVSVHRVAFARWRSGVRLPCGPPLICGELVADQVSASPPWSPAAATLQPNALRLTGDGGGSLASVVTAAARSLDSLRADVDDKGLDQGCSQPSERLVSGGLMGDRVWPLLARKSREGRMVGSCVHAGRNAKRPLHSGAPAMRPCLGAASRNAVRPQ